MRTPQLFGLFRHAWYNS